MERSESGLVVTGGPALIGPDLRPVADAAIVVWDGLIAAAGPVAGTEIPPNIEIVDARGGLIAPGFIDAHVHIGLAEPGAVLRAGVTTVRDLAWPPEDIFPLSQRSRDPGFPGPEVIAAGPMITTPGGYPLRAGWAPAGTGVGVTGEAEARDAVHRVVDAGAAVIKVALNPEVGPVLDAETLFALVDAAHSRGRHVTAHVSGLSELEKALDAGVDELAHMLMSAEAIPSHVIERMVGDGMRVVSTLSIRTGQDRAIAIDNIRRFLAAGGTVLYGTDLGNEGPRPGIDPTEVAALAESGLSAVEIVRAATVTPARVLGLDDRGVLEAGRRADIVVLGEGAQTQTGKLTEIRQVIRGGHVVTRP